MAKCVFCKKHRTLKGYYQCQVTGGVTRYYCDDCSIEKCKYSRKRLIDRIDEWFFDKFDRW